ncbi:MAG: hypothetical protein JWO31_2851 [Phycisphaerales bacterium]|nr:hypothetical protein [Phycisphaerales bacterium]
MLHPVRTFRLLARRAAPSVAGLAVSVAALGPALGAEPVAVAPPSPVPPATAPAAKDLPDESFLAGQRRHRENGREEYAPLDDGGEAAMGDLVRLSLDAGGVLRAEPTDRVLGADDARRYRVKGAVATCTVAVDGVRGPPAAGGGGRASLGFTTTVSRADHDVTTDDGMWFATLSADGSSLSAMGRSVLAQVMFSQRPFVRGANPVAMPGGRPAPRPVTLRVTEWRAGMRQAVVFRGDADTVAELRAKHPREVRRYLLPLLGKVADDGWWRPGVADVYTAFEDVPADPAVAGVVQALLPDLDAADAPTRQAAATRLADLGPAGVLAVLRADPETLSPQQRAQLGRYVAAHRRRVTDSPVDARRDPAFLADCLEHDDPAVRRAAKAALERLTGRPVAFDPDGPVDGRAAAADGVREELYRTALTAPATAPATTRPRE